MATHSNVLAWRIPETGEPGGLLSMGLHRVGHDWSDLAAAAVLHCIYVPHLLYPFWPRLEEFMNLLFFLLKFQGVIGVTTLHICSMHRLIYAWTSIISVISPRSDEIGHLQADMAGDSVISLLSSPPSSWIACETSKMHSSFIQNNPILFNFGYSQHIGPNNVY